MEGAEDILLCVCPKLTSPLPLISLLVPHPFLPSASLLDLALGSRGRFEEVQGHPYSPHFVDDETEAQEAQ